MRKKRYLLNLSVCALCLKWKYSSNKKGATTDVGKEYESTVGSTFRHFRLSLVGSRYDISYIAIH
jgi:hypothetical protein